MSFGVGLGDLASVLDTCVKVYNRFKEADETIRDAHDRIVHIRSYVRGVKDRLNNKFGDIDKYPKSEDCLKTIRKMEEMAENVNEIFRKYEKVQQQPKMLSVGWYQILYVCGSSTHDLQTLITGLEKHKEHLSHWMILFIFDGVSPSMDSPTMQTPLQTPVKVKPPVNILFLDSENTGRSVITQAYAMLVAQWTMRTNHEWRIQKIHSAGIDVIHKCGMIDIRKLVPAKLYEGKQSPSMTAQSALFDTPLFNHPYKDEIRKKIGKQVSRGLGRSTFSNYDYIIVFTLKHLWTIQQLLQAAKKTSPSLVGEGKARIVVLGEYGKAKSGSNIWRIQDGLSKKEKKEYWERTISRIKVSFKSWLKTELDWNQPPKGAPQK